MTSRLGGLFVASSLALAAGCGGTVATEDTGPLLDSGGRRTPDASVGAIDALSPPRADAWLDPDLDAGPLPDAFSSIDAAGAGPDAWSVGADAFAPSDPTTPLCSTTGCRDYYVSSESGDDTDDGLTPATAWRTLARVQMARRTIHAGDTILFERGGTYEGPFRWEVSGAEGRPITFGNYGAGERPLFVLAPGSTVELENRDLLYFGGTSYIVVDGFRVTDLDIAADPVRLADHDMFAYVGTAIRMETYSDTAPIEGVVVRNSDISLVGMGVVFLGVAHSTLENTRIHNLKNLVNTCGAPGSGLEYEDYGANGLTLLGDDNLVIGNTFEGNWATSCDFEFNGGAIELFGGVNRNQFLYNTVIDSGGVAEFGSNDGATMADNLFAYNLFIDNGSVSWANTSGIFGSDISNVQFTNNTIIERGTRFTDSFLFGFSGRPSASNVFTLRNNLFYVTEDLDIVSPRTDFTKIAHENNVFSLSGGSTTGFTIHASERSVSGIPFTRAVGDVLSWDYRPTTASMAIGAGLALGFTRDHGGAPVTTPPDIGAFQH